MDATEKRKRFAASYVIDRNGKKAAIAAGFSAATASAAASRLLKHPEVVAELKRLKKERAEAERALDEMGDQPEGKQPLDFLLGVMNDPEQDPKLRVRAAIAAAQYKHTKRGDGGKKDDQADKAKKASSGKFKAAPPPLKLVTR